MSFEFFPGVGTVHLQTVKKARVVPASERHKWSAPAVRGGKPVFCTKCGCKKAYRRDYTTQYLMPDGRQLTEERPACTGTPPTSTATATSTT